MAPGLRVGAAYIATAFAIAGFVEWGVIGSTSTSTLNPTATGNAFLSLLVGTASLFVAVALWISILIVSPDRHHDSRP